MAAVVCVRDVPCLQTAEIERPTVLQTIHFLGLWNGIERLYTRFLHPAGPLSLINTVE